MPRSHASVPWVKRQVLLVLAVFCLLYGFIAVQRLTGSRQGTWSEPLSCIPIHHIAFLKTHKCGSSTVQNILLRYGYDRNLTFVLPREIYLSRSPFRPEFARAQPENLFASHFDVFAHHTVWNRAGVSALMPPDTVYITILRDPVDVFESLYTYVNLEELYKRNLTELLQSSPMPPFTLRRDSRLGPNQMLYDAGLPPFQMGNRTAVAAKIREMDDNFHLVMISEEMEASLVLMKNLMCWDLADVTSLPLNVRQDAKKLSLAPAERERLRRWMWPDQMLYDHFAAKFQVLKAAYGLERLERDVQALRDANFDAKRRCGIERTNDVSHLPKALVPYQHEKMETYHLRSRQTFCVNLVRVEPDFTKMLKKWQLRRFISKNVMSPKTRLIRHDREEGKKE
ncbi:unnamed protein product [Darwinula stevensoni]|uniref:Uncharacterized protein n=1 Tax=Darwinula stevensoni TaxID=69355 RepID=A0A7R9A674_9CRUS|nr:unnamed protein product [Darwinula stevensoni]CAG0893595.1 unnamed protein product [Darwinula stevensoni]